MTIFRLSDQRDVLPVLSMVQEKLFSISGKLEIEIRKPKRTIPQNSMIHALFSDFCKEAVEKGVKFSIGGIQATPTNTMIKEMFKMAYLGGKSTTKVNTAELADAVDKFVFDAYDEFNISLNIK